MPGSELIVNATPFETRVALLENDQVVELFIERNDAKGLVGNIYKGKVLKVLPGLQAAFIDIGIEKAAFLYVGDIAEAALEPEKITEIEVDEDEVAKRKLPPETPEEESDTFFAYGGKAKRKTTPIQKVIKEGQEIIVQVIKDIIGTKGARVTTYITLPGRYLVYMPNVDHVGVSRRIESEEERERLKGIVTSIKRKGGFIVRTVSADIEQNKLKGEIDFLVKLWSETSRRARKMTAPKMVHTEVGIVLRSARDLFTKDVDRLVIDNTEVCASTVRFVNAFLPRFRKAVVLFEGKDSIFEHYGVNLEISRALGTKVWLKSGGYIIIELTEALTSIDVNTGRFVGRKDLEDTALMTNLEAAKEIAIQVRLRNIGGIIIVDFIDMEKEENSHRVFETVVASFQNDRAKTHVLPMSEIGLIQITRKRTRESINRLLTDPCPTCEGRGHVMSLRAITFTLMDEAMSVIEGENVKLLTVLASEDLVNHLYRHENAIIEDFEATTQVTFRIEPVEGSPREFYEFLLE